MNAAEPSRRLAEIDADILALTRAMNRLPLTFGYDGERLGRCWQTLADLKKEISKLRKLRARQVAGRKAPD